MKVIGLIRVSSQAQEFESQSIKVREAILADGYDESDIILIEDKESGSKLSEEERSGLNKLKYYIETEQISSVYVYEISRISRKETVLYSIREYLQLHHVQLVCITPPFKMFNDDWSISDAAAFTFSIFSTLSSQETRIRVARITRGKEKKKAEGKLTCGKPIFGYDVDKDHFIIPHKKNADIVREIFERYCNLESSGSIGKDLYQRNALGNDKSKEITIQTYVCSILKEKRYAKIDEDSIYPPIISKELFYKAKNIRENKGEMFIKKSKTVRTYPLQGYLYTEDGYMLSSSYTNNRYLKMNDAAIKRVSLNMNAADGLTKIIMNEYINSGVLDIDREKEVKVLSNVLSLNKVKISGIEIKINEIREENERINNRIVKGRMSEMTGDKMIDDNILSMNKLEDEKQELIYQNGVIVNKIDYLSNPLFTPSSSFEINTPEELKDLVMKYLKKAVVHKLGFSRYKIDYYFLDGRMKSGCFYSVQGKGISYYDIK